ncbi:MAG: peptide-methionine (R)-S-oxide reductase MsrB [Methanomicrobiales archaeon]|nr:peptide-methionine (R)-S-oxide reductase MsrB [Methanomicrobiales archaeon]
MEKGMHTGNIPLFVVATGKVEQVEPVRRTDDEWRRLLPPTSYQVARGHGTEQAFTGRYHNFHGDGIYRCICCGTDLFDSLTKFDSGTGWPSFSDPVAPANVTLRTDTGYGMVRTEVLCARCDAHLGHVFDDGPLPSGKRYCMNSASLRFVARGDIREP